MEKSLAFPSTYGRGLWRIHDGTWRSLTHQPRVYSAECVEGRFSEVHIIQRRTQLAPSSHPRLATSAADGPLHSRRPQKERTDLCERTRAARLVMNVATLAAPSRCCRTLCATRYIHLSPDM